MLDTPRDRSGSFEPQLIKKHQTHMSDEIERKILSLYALGSSYLGISGHLEELYGINVSTAAISALTDKIIPKLKEWQNRPLESHYPFIWLDAIHYKVREDGHYRSKAITPYWILKSTVPRKYWVFTRPTPREPTSGSACSQTSIIGGSKIF